MCLKKFTHYERDMRQYLDLLQHILDNGGDKGDRTGTGTRSVFGHQMRFDLSKGFPLLTTKKVHFRSIVIELLWFLKGDTNVKYLQDNKVSIWDEWSTAEQKRLFDMFAGETTKIGVTLGDNYFVLPGRPTIGILSQKR